eukprot:TRINITY_DN1728_c0_g1_i3.p1 TRINITY_DN1728_c0_g1~~TRINITY_DN1728_c0_g1_i3.p1  ORF type:complete len:437 (+),score=107.91 TRINITY_DN1728_c0_g1_i3:75-1313(+)
MSDPSTSSTTSTSTTTNSPSPPPHTTTTTNSRPPPNAESLMERYQAAVRERVAIATRSSQGVFVVSNEVSRYYLPRIVGNHVSALGDMSKTEMLNDTDIHQFRRPVVGCLPQTNALGVATPTISYSVWAKFPVFNEVGGISYISTFSGGKTPVDPTGVAELPTPLLFSAAKILELSLQRLSAHLPTNNSFISCLSNAKMITKVFENLLKVNPSLIPLYPTLTPPATVSDVSTLSPEDFFSRYKFDADPSPVSSLLKSASFSPPFSPPESLSADALSPRSTPESSVYSFLNFDGSNSEEITSTAPSQPFQDDTTPNFIPHPVCVTLPQPTSIPSTFFYCGSSLFLTVACFAKKWKNSGPVFSLVIEPECELHVVGDRLLFIQTLYTLFHGASICSPPVVPLFFILLLHILRVV